MQNKRKIKKAISAGEGFFLAVFLFLLLVCAELAMGLFSARTFETSLQSADYQEKAYEIVCEETEKLAEKNGIQAEGKELFKKDEAFLDFFRYKENVFQGKDTQKASKKAAESCETAILNYLTAAEGNITPQTAVSAKEFGTAAGAVYGRWMTPDFVTGIYKMDQAGRSVAGKLAAGAAAGACIMMILLWKLHRYKHRAVRVYTLSVFTAAVWNLLAVCWFQGQTAAEKLGIASGAYLEFVKEYMAYAVRQCFVWTGLYLLAGIGCLLAVRKIKRSMK